MTDLNLLYTDIEDALRASLRPLLADRCQPAEVAAAYEGDHALATSLWTSLASELGLTGLLVSEELGGVGGSAREVAVVLEELGRTVAPVPFLTSSVMSAAALLDPAVTSVGRLLLGRVAGGETVAALAVPFGTGPGHEVHRVALDAEGHVSGRVRSVAGALEADVLLVPAAGVNGVTLVQVEVASATLVPVTSLDMTRPLADLELDGAPSTVLVPAEAAGRALERGLLHGAALLASEQLGVARWCLDTTVTYVKERRQFGRPVGGFQALKHRLADLFALVETAEGVARYAAATLADDDEDAGIAASIAQSFCGDAAVRAAEEAVQLHGGIGMTWEHPLHLYLKRAKADQAALGGSAFHRERLADLVNLPLTAN